MEETKETPSSHIEVHPSTSFHPNTHPVFFPGSPKQVSTVVEDEDREEEEKTENQATSQAVRDTQLPVIESGVMGDLKWGTFSSRTSVLFSSGPRT